MRPIGKKLYVRTMWVMATPRGRQQKRQTLRRHGTLNAQPESVTQPLFQNSDFFDPDDLLQVKYEMLRQVHADQNSISEAARPSASLVRRSTRRNRHFSRTE